MIMNKVINVRKVCQGVVASKAVDLHNAHCVYYVIHSGNQMKALKASALQGGSNLMEMDMKALRTSANNCMRLLYEDLVCPYDWVPMKYGQYGPGVGSK